MIFRPDKRRKIEMICCWESPSNYWIRFSNIRYRKPLLKFSSISSTSIKMAPSPLQQRRTHNTLLLQKLLNLRDGASPFTLILDTLEQSGGPVVREFVRRAKVWLHISASRTWLFCELLPSGISTHKLVFHWLKFELPSSVWENRPQVALLSSVQRHVLKVPFADFRFVLSRYLRAK